MTYFDTEVYTLYTVIPKWQPFLMENVLSLRVVHLVLALLIKAARATIWGGEGGRQKGDVDGNLPPLVVSAIAR